MFESEIVKHGTLPLAALPTDSLVAQIDRQKKIAELRKLRSRAIEKGMELWNLEEVNAEIARGRSR